MGGGGWGNFWAGSPRLVDKLSIYCTVNIVGSLEDQTNEYEKRYNLTTVDGHHPLLQPLTVYTNALINITSLDGPHSVGEVSAIFSLTIIILLLYIIWPPPLEKSLLFSLTIIISLLYI